MGAILVGEGFSDRLLGLSDLQAALIVLARAIVISPLWWGMPVACIIARSSPQPVLGLLGRFDPTGDARLTALGQGLDHIVAHVRYIDYTQAERDCAQLAAQLVARFGSDELRRFRFMAIPRGGHIVLHILAYTLGLERTQLELPHPLDVPLVVADDCAFGAGAVGGQGSLKPSAHVIFCRRFAHQEAAGTK